MTVRTSDPHAQPSRDGLILMLVAIVLVMVAILVCARLVELPWLWTSLLLLPPLLGLLLIGQLWRQRGRSRDE
ncbi:hypothetical protein [Aeromonas simiae]|uniref:hypothetical protein n=1 Tax=Aeromonas simiae TaxID=218936 RepID=UPI0005A893D7|nr:hypothetical protein [Aeromonas simiae]MDO2949359.1 hypothetical protein [Aeromonas simiae]MDO2952823.1 hypothetical protein [Aeromonas simiae]MDO2956518.1 hypothetical protein [Aeromonas simiae]